MKQLQLQLRPHNISVALLTMALLSACSSEQVDGPLVPGKEISIFSRASTGDAASSAHLLFWMESDYNAFRTGAAPVGSPYAKSDLPQEIDTYKLSASGEGTPFNTFKPYPSPTSTLVYASGFAPSNAYDKTFTTGYDEIPIVEEMQDGLTDFLASNNDGTSRGSYDEPFIKDKDAAGLTEEQRIAYNRDRELKFRHLTACISFKAMRNESMYYKIGVRNVKIEIINDDDDVKKLAVPTSIKTYNNVAADKWTYVAGSEIKPVMLEGYVAGDVMMTEGKQLAEFYVNTADIEYGEDAASGQFEPFDGLATPITSPQPTLKVNIEAEFFWVQDPTQIWPMRWENRTVTDKDWTVATGAVATGDRFLPGYKYEVTINFNNTAIGLKAVQLPWEPGGTYYYSVWDKSEVGDGEGGSGSDEGGEGDSGS